MSIEQGLLVAVIAFVALVVAIILGVIYMLVQLRQLTRTANQVEEQLNAVTIKLTPLIEHTDTTIQTLNESMVSTVAIVKNSKQITKSIAATLQAVQEVTHNIAQKAEVKLRDEAAYEQAQLTLQWTELVMQTVKMLQQKKQNKME